MQQKCLQKLQLNYTEPFAQFKSAKVAVLKILLFSLQDVDARPHCGNPPERPFTGTFTGPNHIPAPGWALMLFFHSYLLSVTPLITIQFGGFSNRGSKRAE